MDTSNTDYCEYWQCPEAQQKLNQARLAPPTRANQPEEREPLLDSPTFDPFDYQVIINPKLLKESVTRASAWEYCASFPQIRALVNRPVGIEVSYLNENGDEVETKF